MDLAQRIHQISAHIRSDVEELERLECENLRRLFLDEGCVEVYREGMGHRYGTNIEKSGRGGGVLQHLRFTFDSIPHNKEDLLIEVDLYCWSFAGVIEHDKHETVFYINAKSDDQEKEMTFTHDCPWLYYDAGETSEDIEEMLKEAKEQLGDHADIVEKIHSLLYAKRGEFSFH